MEAELELIEGFTPGIYIKSILETAEQKGLLESHFIAGGWEGNMIAKRKLGEPWEFYRVTKMTHQ
jgi:hypothetical protein